MKKVLQLLLVIFCIVGIINSSYAERVPERFLRKSSNELKASAAGCAPGAGFEMLEVNNVRSRVNTSGDMWQNFATGIAQYFIPANTTKTSLFAGALWIGGEDVNGQLKLAAQRFRQVGVDYWPGPLTIDGSASTTLEVCAEWDKMYRISKAEVQEFIGWFNSENRIDEYPGYSIPASIRDWPAHGNIEAGQALYLAPFFDNDGDGFYNPAAGDYPYYDFDNVLCPLNYVDSVGWDPARTMGTLEGEEHGGILSDQVIKGDETLWWVFNDKGNNHTETSGQSIGLEIRAQSFGFATNDEINNMTFFSYEIINRSTFTLTETYFAPWTDADLGYARDDLVGCDVERGMGYCYNGSNTDGSGQAEAYGANPPAVGIDFFQGPYLDPDGYDNPAYKTTPLKGPSFALYTNPCEIVTNHGQMMRMSWGVEAPHNEHSGEVMVRAEAINGVNFGNGIEDDERFGMRRFVYHNNLTSGINIDPHTAVEYYNYLRGMWTNGAVMTHDGKDATGEGPLTDFMFPGTTDKCRWGIKGDQYPSGTEDWRDSEPEDRRFMQSAGPFTLLPGAVNYITFGVPWARATGDAWSSVVKLQEADDKCQALFDNCFKVLNGPDAPDMSFVELDQRIIVHLTNSKLSNNFNEKYVEYDNTIVRGDSLYRFEGYQIYQVVNKEIGVEAISDQDISKARLIRSCDVVNGVTRIVNWDPEPTTGLSKPILRASGTDSGIEHTFEITEDAFATGDNRKLVNNRNYYFIAIAYAYNNFQEFDFFNTAGGGQMQPYLAGRKLASGRSISAQAAMPHKTINGLIINSKYGDVPSITRVEGKGNGGLWLEISDSLRKAIGSKPPLEENVLFGGEGYPWADNGRITYEKNAGPLNIKVVDPLNVQGHDYRLVFYNCQDTYNPMNSTRRGSDFTYAYFIEKARWKLMDENEKEYFPDTLLTITKSPKSETQGQMLYTTRYEQIFTDLGISITIDQVYHPGDYWMRPRGNGFLGYTATFADSSKKWLTGISDQDIPGLPINWIRSGSYYETGESPDPKTSDYDMFNYPSSSDISDEEKLQRTMDAWDPFQNYESIFNGTWAPYTLCATVSKDYGSSPALEQSYYGPAVTNLTKTNNLMTSVNSVDIVFTNDKSLWTRSVVVEMGWIYPYNEGNGSMFAPRVAQSVDKDGNPAPVGSGGSDDPNDPNYISETGMGWFPGYAVNVETGERLNIIFGENSYFSEHNGRDMLFNPSPEISDVMGANYYMGGMHYVYIMGHKVWYKDRDVPSATSDPDKRKGYPRELPAYDAGRTYMKLFNSTDAAESKYCRYYVFGSCMWVGMPIPEYTYADIWDHWIKGSDDPRYMENMDFTLKIRVAKPYARYESEILTNPARIEGGLGIEVDPEYAASIQNDHWPVFEFSTKEIGTVYNDPTKAKTDLDLIAVVPNPYYAYSSYEQNSTDNRVRITNLPRECTVTIYNIGGTMVRQFSKNDDVSTYDWDLKNFAGVPISGGVYLVHVKSPAGEKLVKWFGVIRTVDLFTF